MNYLLDIVLALATLLLPQLLEIDPGPELALLVPVAVTAPYGIAWVMRRLARAGRIKAAGVADRVLGFSAVLVQASSVALFGWMAAIEPITGSVSETAAWPGLELFAALSPFLLTMVATIDARARLHERTADGIRRARTFQLRLFASAVLPFVVYLGVSGLIGSHAIWRVYLEQVAMLSAGFTTLLIAVFVLVLPRLLTATWGAVPLEPGGLRSFLEGIARRADFRCRDLLIWRTGGQMANAAIVGFTPRSRVVLFSDVLLDSLDPLEVAAVFGHEMGHAKRRHALVFAAHAISILLAADFIGSAVELESAIGAGAMMGVALVAWFVTFGYLSRRFELEADLESLDLMGDSVPLIRALQRVTGAHAYHRTSWRHFSTEERVRFLHSVEANPIAGINLRRRLRKWSRVVFALFAVVVGLQVVDLSRSWRRDHVYVDLRLGNYDRASERLVSIGGLDDERVEALVRLGASLPDEDRAPDALERDALREWTTGDGERAIDLLRLSLWRGRSVAEDLLYALDARVNGEPDDELEETLPSAWRRALQTGRGPSAR